MIKHEIDDSGKTVTMPIGEYRSMETAYQDALTERNKANEELNKMREATTIAIYCTHFTGYGLSTDEVKRYTIREDNLGSAAQKVLRSIEGEIVTDQIDRINEGFTKARKSLDSKIDKLESKIYKLESGKQKSYNYLSNPEIMAISGLAFIAVAVVLAIATLPGGF